MKIISHRGYWKVNSEKNTSIAFERSFSLCFGTETDIRDYNAKLVISHDIANQNCMPVDDFLHIYKKHDKVLPLALNIKADGLQQPLSNLLNQYQITSYFVFDMSVPDTIGYIKKRIRFYSRQSEYEPMPAFYDECAGIWLDSFHGTWFSNRVIMDHLSKNKEVAIVSSELHNREYKTLWEQLKEDGLNKSEALILCTDVPEEAVEFFKEA
jgi:hypothetical protein